MALKRKVKKKKSKDDEVALRAVEDALNNELDELALDDVSDAPQLDASNGSDETDLLENEIDLDELEQKLTTVANDLRAEDDKLDIELSDELDASLNLALSDELESQDTQPDLGEILSLADAGQSSAHTIVEDNRPSRTSKIPAGLAGTDNPVLAANDDGKETISDLVYALQSKPKSSVNWISATLAITWVAGCVFYAFTNMGAEFSALSSFRDYFTSPAILVLAAAIILPILTLWAFASMIRRAQEMRHAAQSMTEAAIRLLQPTDIASDSFNTLGHAIRREVSAIGDGVERALARAGELENMVQNEVTSLERSYTDSEIKLRGLVSELSGERENIEGHAEKLRLSISNTHQGFSEEIDSVTLRIQDAVTQASGQIADTMDDKSTTISASLLEAGDSLVAKMSSAGSDAQARMAASGEAVGVGMEAKTSELTDRIKLAGNAMASLLDTRSVQISQQSDEITKKFEKAVSQRSSEFAERINEAGSTLNSALDTRISTISSTLSTKGITLVEALGMRTETLDKILSEKSASINTSIDKGLSSIVDGLDTKTVALDKVMSERTSSIGDTIADRLTGFGNTLTGHVDKAVTQLTENTENLERTTTQVGKAIDERTASLNDTLLSRTKELAETFGNSEIQITTAISKGHKKVTEGLDQKITQTTANLDEKAEKLSKLLSDRSAEINETMGANLVETQRSIEEGARDFGEKAQSINADLSARADEFSSIIDDKAVPMVESMRAASQEVATQLGDTSQIVDKSVGDVIDKLGSSNEILRTLVDQAGENLGTIQASLAQQSSSLMKAFDKATSDLELSGKLAHDVQQGMETTAAGLLSDVNSVAGRLDEQGQILVEATRLIDASQTNFATTLDSRQEILKELSDGLVQRSDEIESTMTKLAMAVTQMLEDANMRSRELGGIVSAEVSTAINDATARFNNATESMKIAARDVSAELEQTREQMRRGVLELPDETRQSADSMRRVVTDQIKALKDLSEIVTRSGKALDATSAARDSRQQANAAAPLMQSTAPALATATPVQPAAPFMPPQRQQPAQPYFAPPAPVRQAPPKAQRPTPRQVENPNAGSGWVSDLLRRASSDEPVSPPAPATNSPNRSPQNVVESLNALSMDIARAIDHEASIELWDRYQRGERNVFTRRLYTIQGQQTFDEIQRKYQTEPDFRNAVTRYVEDFERLLADIAKNDRDNVMSQTYLTSDTGKVYTMLAHASGRLG